MDGKDNRIKVSLALTSLNLESFIVIFYDIFFQTIFETLSTCVPTVMAAGRDDDVIQSLERVDGDESVIERVANVNRDVRASGKHHKRDFVVLPPSEKNRSCIELRAADELLGNRA